MPAMQSPDPIGNAEYASALVLSHGNRTHLPSDELQWDADIFFSRHVGGANHFDLLNHPAIYAQMRRCLGSQRALPAPAQRP